ncbi:Uncharacterized protein FKW44_001123 [Caligus rogercresseyi]|uniref:Uncharacterized protein n=1 Tax=Caligus rogercresseyi TaxID=217165 RepID=A0A7T8QVB5_CALRO|nr:Uncharacterized protein FKW44_001123 [Caligus rogercresseyi]
MIQFLCHSRSTSTHMDQLEAEAGLTWDDALARLKDLEKTLKCEIQSNIREMKLCMTSYKIEDVSLKAARLHDIRRTLASSRALVREECAIMKEFEKIKGILGTCRTMDEDDWSDTKNQTRYWGDKLAEVRRRQRRISGDVVDLDSVVSDIITRSDLENDSVDSLDNLSFHLTSYPLFNSAPYGHHLSVPSRPGSAMSDVSAVSTGIAGYFKGRDTTTDMSQSETEQSVTPTIQKKKLFTRSSSSGRDPSLDGSEDERAGVSMEEMYMKEKHKSAMAFKKKAVSEREANLKAIEDHEDEVISEAEGFCDEDEAGISRPSSVLWKEDDGAKIEEGKNEMEQDLQKKMDEQEIQRRAEEQEFQRKMQEERKLEAAMMKEQEEEKKRIEDQENQLKEAEVEKKRIEKEKLKEQVEERKRIEAEEKKKLADEKQKKLEEKKQKEEEKKIKLEEKKKRDEEKKRNWRTKRKKKTKRNRNWRTKEKRR